MTTSFDGRAYLGAEFIGAQSYHAGAPAVAEACFQSMIAGYFASRYRGQLIGHQTYPHRQRYAANRSNFRSGTNVDLAEFIEAYLPEHATHVGAEIYFGHTPGDEIASGIHSVIVTDGTNTDTGDDSTIALDPDNAFGFQGLVVFRAVAEVALSAVTQPGAVKIKVRGYSKEAVSSTARDYTPLSVAVWRWTQ